MLDEWVRALTGNKDATSFFKSKQGKYLVIIAICLGLLALIWGPSASTDNSVKQLAEVPDQFTTSNHVKMQLTQELKHILGQIEGAGKVEVSITLASDGAKSYAGNSVEEQRQISETTQGGSQQTIEKKSSRDLVVSSGSPLLIESKFPEVIGVLIVAEGAKSSSVKEKIASAAATLLDIPPHKVSVMPGQEGGI
ncbi:MAG: hypothetical protein GX808_01205 [Syntrophomonadaceae bacterium]|nr:hypothetical protein [Syntrophomonadaceae bacterium]